MANPVLRLPRRLLSRAAKARLFAFALSTSFFPQVPTLAHDGYSGWKNQQDRSCCNNTDCQALKPEDVQLHPKVRVRIEGQWCEVREWHYLSQGNAPERSSNHACWRRSYYDGHEVSTDESPCERLLCFQPETLY
jgi:hypothetical protein